MEARNTQSTQGQILSSIVGRRGRRGRTLSVGEVTLVSGGHGGSPELRPPSPQSDPKSAFSWSIMRFLFSEGFPLSELPSSLIFWAEVRHPESFAHLERVKSDPDQVRRTLGAMYRRMEKDEETAAGEDLPGEPDQAEPVTPRRWCDALAEAVANDPISHQWLKPYIDRDERGMHATALLDKDYRGQRYELDKRITERCL